MQSLDDIRRLFAFDAWANRETLASLRAAVPPPEQALRWMAHIAAAELRRHGHTPAYTDFIHAVRRGFVE